MLVKRSLPSPRAGVAVVEMAFALPLLLLLLVGIWEVGRMVEAQQILSSAAREGGRQAATGQRDYNGIQTTTTEGGSDVNVKVGIRNLTTDDGGSAGVGESANYNPQDATQLDNLEVTVELPYANVKWAFIDRWFFSEPDSGGSGAGADNIVARAVWTSMKDLPIEVDTNIPQKPQ
jgi:Flp pilus assembly protein TadG